MTKSYVEFLFQSIDGSAGILQHELSITYLEAVAETGENIFQKEILQQVSDLSQKKLHNIYGKIQLDRYSKEEIRKAMQLSVLKGMKEALQPRHAMTPDAVSIFIGYLVNKWMGDEKQVAIFDPVVGTGNLLTAILNGMPEETAAFGIEADETLLRLAYVNANLQAHRIELFHGDAVRPLFVDPVDLVVADLPIGYYPNDDIAEGYELKASSGHSFVHHLLIEQSLRYAKEGAVLIFLIPNGLFEQEGAAKLHTFLKEKAVIQGLLQLPLSMFKNEESQKSIFMIRKKSDKIEPPKQVLLASLPSFSDERKLSHAITKINEWFDENVPRKRR
ncbi:SAM-dependent methyltransferase [Pueribacillus theae]|uniref:SAM-dependent methyltransferase n=1 Tax=Pueribacillus theae TaxID=2171751 RepID=A0A2U1K0V4_9BACI|nr:class I SAM-dependent methyltransferase [Pueribacillus theae]PWA11136.1 SAM-dependent methyltransferase [Pueribacillus theae]